MDEITEFREQGCLLRQGLIPSALVDRLKSELAAAIEAETRQRGTTAFADYGMLLAAPVYGGAILDLAGYAELFAPVEKLLGETCIIHVYTSSSLPPGGTNYGARIHHERSDRYPDLLDFVALIVLLDDFTVENGATWYLPGSHRLRQAPESQDFYQRAKRLLAPAGSVFYFDWRLYHAGGVNGTSAWRHSLAMGLTPAYYKQKIDLPRAIPSEFCAHMNARARQKLGFDSVPPASVAEYYKPLEERSYRQKPL